MSDYQNVKVLLLQARDAGEPAGPHELKCFTELTGIPSENITLHDLLTGPPTIAGLSHYDALMIGGSGNYYVSRGNMPHGDEFEDFLRQIVAINFPTFASCFGFQYLAHALEGEVIHDPENAEVGTYEVNLTPYGESDELFGQLPLSFMAQLGHKDRVFKLPEHAQNLASSQRSPFQAFRVEGKPIWAAQFHPELSDRTNLERAMMYQNSYSLDTMAEFLEGIKPTPEANSLLRKFMGIVFD